MSYIPKQGDIITIDFHPSSGKEINKRRPGVVLSRAVFNEKLGYAIVAPITSTIRGLPIEVALDDRTSTKGVIHPFQARSFDFYSRAAEFIEQAPKDLIERACNLLTAFIEPAG